MSKFQFAAASVMYEQAFRLLHLNTVEALEKQVKCYLAAKNVLQLCKPEFAWVVRPTDPDEEVEEVILEPLAGSKKVIYCYKLYKVPKREFLFKAVMKKQSRNVLKKLICY